MRVLYIPFAHAGCLNKTAGNTTTILVATAPSYYALFALGYHAVKGIM